ncbi:MAG: hypothetical protein Q7W45_17000 [Bacteroidota bacterium]|nr:hypothetical protein [Bacteroidota bacterium]MDP3145287.1 hypothetical protein [Bacteroidota bacterium]MDP3556879.1 hypothetical protein [Bacteroidota bacterium]
MKKFIIALSFISLTASFNKVNAQCDTIANICAKHIIASFISDGQQYRALLLNSEETAEFQTTFFGETTYRIAACSGTSDGNLIFNIYDQDRHLLFTNRDKKNAPYWDFKVKSTLETIIEAQLDANRNPGSGCAVMLIGFKQK